MLLPPLALTLLVGCSTENSGSGGAEANQSAASSSTASGPGGAGGTATVTAATSGGSGGAGQGGGGGAGPELGAEVWTAGALSEPLPAGNALLPLPGAGTGNAVFTSNNPEVFQGNGLLYGTGRASDARGGGTFPLSGDFGVYLHHINQSGAPKVVTLMVTNPGNADVTVSAAGSGFNQTETGGLGLGDSPDYFVSEDWILDTPTTVVAPTALAPQKPLAIWQKSANHNAELDGRFALSASGPVYVYLVVTDGTDLNEAIAVYKTDAPGIIAVSGNPPPPFGREAGVYGHDTWQGSIDIAVPAAAHHVGFMVNTATGAGYPQIQAFPALTHYDDSAAESVGMYGNVYDLTVQLHHDGADGSSRKTRVSFASLVNAAISRYWDGVGLVDGVPVVIRHVPGDRRTLLADVVVHPGETKEVHFRAMVPGLTSIPQALYLESY
jgi:hypothetical protein